MAEQIFLVVELKLIKLEGSIELKVEHKLVVVQLVLVEQQLF
jgi:hypothetical protein